MFYNQTGSDEHIDINSVTDVNVENNLYYSQGASIPEDAAETVNFYDNAGRIVADPILPDQEGLVVPGWDENSGTLQTEALPSERYLNEWW